jgi:hypothetical protein
VLAERLAVIRERRITGQALLTDDTPSRAHRRSA